MQQDSLMEKCVVLDEVDALTSHLRDEAAAARPIGASLAAAANAYQERLRKVTRGMMATISELSLYQVRMSQHTCVRPRKPYGRQAGSVSLSWPLTHSCLRRSVLFATPACFWHLGRP